MIIRRHFLTALNWIFWKCGCARHQINDSIDILLAMPVIFLAFFAQAPVIVFLGKEHVTGRLIVVAIASSIIGLGISLLSPNWRFVISAAFAFLALRSVVGFLVSHEISILLLGIANIAIAVGVQRWKASNSE
jgi:hypothetical protein